MAATASAGRAAPDCPVTAGAVAAAGNLALNGLGAGASAACRSAPINRGRAMPDRDANAGVSGPVAPKAEAAGTGLVAGPAMGGSVRRLKTGSAPGSARGVRLPGGGGRGWRGAGTSPASARRVRPRDAKTGSGTSGGRATTGSAAIGSGTIGFGTIRSGTIGFAPGGDMGPGPEASAAFALCDGPAVSAIRSPGRTGSGSDDMSMNGASSTNGASPADDPSKTAWSAGPSSRVSPGRFGKASVVAVAASNRVGTRGAKSNLAGSGGGKLAVCKLALCKLAGGAPLSTDPSAGGGATS